MSHQKPNPFASIKKTVDPERLEGFLRGADAHQVESEPAPAATAPTSAPPAAVPPVVSAPALATKELPKTFLLRLADTPGLAEKLNDVFQRSTYKSQQQMVAALLSDALDRLNATLTNPERNV